ncbi:MAG: HypC/HybG/HupF family hydrogenase formation chaperone [Gammaproteobacteria bacterium]|nr:HypC/HybG/HupF family hydrogenase formation chaperone [Gammaproteobacteria bacterium]
MCLALPAKITELLPNNRAIVNLGGVKKEICIDLIDQVKEGDYVIIHVGYALTKLDEVEAKKTLAMIQQMASR